MLNQYNQLLGGTHEYFIQETVRDREAKKEKKMTTLHASEPA